MIHIYKQYQMELLPDEILYIIIKNIEGVMLLVSKKFNRLINIKIRSMKTYYADVFSKAITKRILFKNIIDDKILLDELMKLNGDYDHMGLKYIASEILKISSETDSYIVPNVHIELNPLTMRLENEPLYKSIDTKIVIMKKIIGVTIDNEIRQGVLHKGSAKYRANKLFVDAIVDKFDPTLTTNEILNTSMGHYTIYKVGEIVEPDAFDYNLNNTCAWGIHFFKTFDPAFTYDKSILVSNKYVGKHTEYDIEDRSIIGTTIFKADPPASSQNQSGGSFETIDAFTQTTKKNNCISTTTFYENGNVMKKMIVKKGINYFKQYDKKGCVTAIDITCSNDCTRMSSTFKKNGHIQSILLANGLNESRKAFVYNMFHGTNNK